MSVRPEEGGAEAIFAAWLLRVESGEEAGFDALLAAHPAHTDELRRLHDDWQLFAPLLGKAVPGRIEGEQGIVLAPLSGTSAEAGEPASAELLERLGIEVPQSGRYRFRAVIGRGGGGVVLKVWDAKLNRALAMKVVLGRDEERPTGTTPKVDGLTLSRFVDEARIASQLNHPGIVPVHELGLDETGRAFFTMKLVKGEDLAQVFEHVKTGHDGWNPTRALNVLLRVCESVAFAHEKGVIHRDLKPANVMVGRHGEVYVMDWGLARVLGEEDKKDVRVRPPAATSALLSVRTRPAGETPDSPLYTMDGDVVGTPAYMAPEQAAGELARMGPHSDVYAVGAMLYHLLAGHMPYVPTGARLNNYAVWQRVQEGPPERIEKLAPHAPLELAAICEKAMAREIAARYRDMPELARDLRAYLEGRVVSAYETGAWAETKKWVRRNRALAASLAAILVVSVVGVLVSTNNARRADEIARLEAVARARAEENEGVARKEQQRADASAEEARWNAYLAAITGAAAARGVGEPATERRLLESAPTQHRRWEWGYLSASADRCLNEIKGLGYLGYTSVEFSPCATRLILSTNEIRGRTIWDTLSGAQILRLEDNEYIWKCSADGTRAVSQVRGMVCRVLDIVGGSEIARIERQPADFTSIDFSPSGALVLTCSNEDYACVWSADSGKELFRLLGHSGKVSSASFSLDGGRIVTCSDDMTARIWDVAFRTEIFQLNGHSARLRLAAFSPDATRVATFADDMTVRIWDIASKAPTLIQCHGHPLPATSILFSPNGSLIATSSAEKESGETIACVWDIDASMKRLHTAVGSHCSISFSENGARLVAASVTDLSARAWDLSSGQEVRTPAARRILSFSPTATRAVAETQGQALRVLEVDVPGEERELKGHIKYPFRAAFSADGALVATTSGDNTVRVWDSALPAAPVRIRGMVYHTSLAFNPQGSQLVTVCDDYSARLWDSITGEERAQFPLDMRWQSDATFSPDGRYIMTVSGGGKPRLWDALTGIEIKRLGLSAHGAFACRFGSDPAFLAVQCRPLQGNESFVAIVSVPSFDEVLRIEGSFLSWGRCGLSGAQVVAVAQDKRICVWDVRSGVLLADWSADGLSGVRSVALGGGVLVSAEGRGVSGNRDGYLAVRDAFTGNERRQIGRTEYGYDYAAISPDGLWVLASPSHVSLYGTVRMWRISTGQEQPSLSGHTDYVSSVGFDPEGARIVTASEDGTVRIWDVVTGAEVLRVNMDSGGVYNAAFSPDGSRLLASTEGGSYVFDGRPYRERFAEREALRRARQRGVDALDQALLRFPDLVEAGSWLHDRQDLDEVVRQTALDLILQGAQQGRVGNKELTECRSRLVWTRRMVGYETWSGEEVVAPGVDAERGAWESAQMAWILVDPDTPSPTEAARALDMVRRALKEGDWRIEAHWARRTICWALFWLGRFDEAFEEGRKAVEEAEAAGGGADALRLSLDRLTAEIAKYRDEQGDLRREVFEEELAALERRITELEADPWVRRWVASQRFP